VGDGAKRTRTDIYELFYRAKLNLKAEGRRQKAKIGKKLKEKR
jgi:hypothetical protein